MKEMEESVAVLLHASALGRTDIIQHAISSLRSNATEEVASIISRGRSPEDEITALHIAATNGHADVVRALLNAGADPSIIPNRVPQESPFLALIEKLPYEVAKETTKKAFHVYFFEQIAIGNLSKIEKLLSGGIPAELLDGSKANDSTLHWACSFNNLEVGRILCSHGINVNIQNNDGQTPLHISCKAAYKDIIELLLQEGANPHMQDKSGKEPKDLVISDHDAITLLLDTIKPTEKPVKLELQPVETSLDSSSNNGNAGVNTTANYDEDGDDKGPMLLLWPPPQRQFLYGDPYPILELNSNTPVLISASCSEIDLYPLTTWSGLLDALDGIGLQAQVKRSAPGSHIRLSVDPILCPGKNRFELNVRIQTISLLASDSAGLLYGIHLLIQILKLHTEVTLDDTVTRVKIPCLSIVDWPDIANRAILWTFRENLRTSTLLMRRTVELLARVRVNQICLVLDNKPKVASTIHGEVDPVSYVDEEASFRPGSARISSLDEVCRRNCVEIVPTIILTNLNEMPVLEQLFNVSSAVVFVAVLFPELGPEVDDATASAYVLEYRRALADTLTVILQSGRHRVMLSCATWLRSVLRPLTMAQSLGLNAVEVSSDFFCPPSMLCRTLLSHDNFLSETLNIMSIACANAALMTVMPAVSTTDYVYPVLSSLFQILLYGGAAWNGPSVVDMLVQERTTTPNQNDASESTVSVDLTILNDTALFLLFPDQSDHRPEVLSALMGLFTGIATAPSATLTHTPGSGSGEVVSSLVTTMSGAMLSSTDMFLWAVLMGPADQSVLHASVPSRSELTECLRHYRRILLSAGWRLVAVGAQEGEKSGQGASGANSAAAGASGATASIDDKKFDFLADELFAVMHLLSIVCRALILAYNVVEKEQARAKAKQPVALQHLPLGGLLGGLQAGTKSDLANALLEALEYCRSIWRRRYENPQFSIVSIDSADVSGSNSYNRPPMATSTNPIQSLRMVFLTQSDVRIPCYDFFKCVANKLPIVIDDVLAKIFLPSIAASETDNATSALN